jgi:hypothetical protein
MSKSECQKKSEIRNSNGLSFARLCALAPLRRKQRRRATPKYETSRNPENFRNYFKTGENSRGSSKDLKDAKMRSSTFLTFDKPREFLKSSKPNCETNEGLRECQSFQHRR